jgi:hypothetical protein
MMLQIGRQREVGCPASPPPPAPTHLFPARAAACVCLCCCQPQQDVLVAFSRDSSVGRECVAQPHDPFVATWGSSGATAPVTSSFPPCGVLPHRVIALYAVPLCYLYSNDYEILSVFRRMVRGSGMAGGRWP